MSLVYNRKSRYPTWCRRWSVGSHLIELALFLSLPFVFLACTSNPPVQNADFGQFVGSYEEVIELPSPFAPGFTDAEFVQLLRPDDIPPVYSPVFVPAHEANLPDDELVIGLAIGNDARAYPAGILFFREMVNDRVNDIPVLVSWCPRCYTALVHDRRIDGEPLVFGNQGALYQGAMTWFDHKSGSVWSQPLGSALAGPEAGATLRLIPSQLTTWGGWRNSHPETVVLGLGEPSPSFSGRRPGPDHVAGVVIGDAAVAVPYDEVPPVDRVQVTLRGSQVAIWRDGDTDAVRAALLDESGHNRKEIPVLIAYRSAWLKFYPGSVIVRASETSR